MGHAARNGLLFLVDDELEPIKATRGKKRTSEQISDDRNNREGTAKPEPSAKRRNTRARNSVAQPVEYPTLSLQPMTMEIDSAPIKPAKGGRKRASTTTRSRRNSGASVASLRAVVPDIAAIEAAIEAELDKPLSDEEAAPELEDKPKRGRTKRGTASKAPIRKSKAVEDIVEVEVRHDLHDEIEQASAIESIEAQQPGKKGRKAKATKKDSSKR